MRSKQYILYFLMMVGMTMLIIPAIPHHHHSDGAICMKDDIRDTGCPYDDHHHHNDDPCCTNDCMAQFESPAPTSLSNEVQPQHIHSITLFTEPLLRFITRPGERNVHRERVYQESLHGIFITCAAGLRAPPLSFSI